MASAKSALDQITKHQPRRVCQHQFKKNDIVWVCRTCQADETCVLCHACFDNSNHVGHDVAFYHAQAGGCCDCGDPDAWDPKGFCSKHGCHVIRKLGNGSNGGDGNCDNGGDGDGSIEERVKGLVASCGEWLDGFVTNVENAHFRIHGRGEKLREKKRSSEQRRDDFGVEEDKKPKLRKLNKANDDDLSTSQNMMSVVVGENIGTSNDSDGGPNSNSTHLIDLDHLDLGVDECKFNPEAASTSKSRLNRSNHDIQVPVSMQTILQDDLSKSSECSNTTTAATTTTFNPVAASTSKSRLEQDTTSTTTTSPDKNLITPAEQLGLQGSQQHGLYLILHDADVPTMSEVSKALKALYYSFCSTASYPRSGFSIEHASDKVASLFYNDNDIGDIIVWGTHELMAELGPVLSQCWKDGDALACTRFGALVMEKAKILSSMGMIVSIKTRHELCREVRAGAIIEFLHFLSESCDSLAQEISSGLSEGDGIISELKEEFNSSGCLLTMLRSDLRIPRYITTSWHALLLTLLAVPSFKAALANAYCDTYREISSEYAKGIGVLEKSAYTLSVQFLNRVTYVQDLVKERDLLRCLATSLLDTFHKAMEVQKENDVSLKLAQLNIDSKNFPPGASTAVHGGYFKKRNESINNVPLNPVLDPLHPVLSHRRYSPCISDLKCVLNVPGMSRLFLSLNRIDDKKHQIASCLDLWIESLYLCQNMDYIRWRPLKEGHIALEAKGWIHAFNASISLGSLFERLLNWEDDEAIPIMKLPGSCIQKNILLNIVDLTHYILVNFVTKWQQIERRNFPSTSFGPKPELCAPRCLPMSTIAVKYGSSLAMEALPLPQSKCWSFHFPLHRFVAACLREVARRMNNDSKEIGGIGVEKLLAKIIQTKEINMAIKLYCDLMEYPVIVLSRAAQVKAGLWRRNGNGMFDQVLNYAEPPFCRALRDADLTLIQFSLIGQLSIRTEESKIGGYGCSAFINLLFHRFGIFSFAGLQQAPDFDEEKYWNEVEEGVFGAEKDFSLPWSYTGCTEESSCLSMLDEFLYTIIMLITELPPPPPENKFDQVCQAKKRLRREVVHRLVSGPKTHSELAEVHHVLPHRDTDVLSEEGKIVHPDDATGSALEEILSSVADKKLSHSKLGPDTWEIKEESWTEYDPAFFHISIRSHQDAAENRSHLGALEKNRALPYAPIPPEAHESFSRIRKDITSDACIVALLYRILHVHCRGDNKSEKDNDAFWGSKLLYQSHVMSETVLAKAIHLLTLSAYAWDDDRKVGGTERGSIFFNSATVPTQQSWVDTVLLANPSEIMSCNMYEGEDNILQLLNILSDEGETDMPCTQDKSIRSGAAWICQYAINNSKRAAALLYKSVDCLEIGEPRSPENEKKKRSREARERIMKKMNKKMAEFMQSVEGNNEEAIEEGAQASSPNRERPDDFTGENVCSSAAQNGDQNIMFDQVGDHADAKIRLLDSRPRCFICAEDGDFTRNTKEKLHEEKSEKVIAFCAFAQASTVLKGETRIPNPEKCDDLSNFVGTHVSLCGHTVHISCIDSHLKDAVDFRRNEFKCPVCRRLSNCLVPFIDAGSDWVQSPQQLSTKKLANTIDNTSSFLQENHPSSLHNFLVESQWWAARNNSDLIWDGRSAFIPLESTGQITSSDGKRVNMVDSSNINRSRRKHQSFLGKKDLYKAWSSAMWTPSCVRCPSKGRSLGNTTSTTITEAWRRFMDQISELSYKVDLKRLGEQNLMLNSGEFRHYYVEKGLYNRESLAPGPLFSEMNRQEISREKLVSKLFTSIQAFTYSCCSEEMECRRLAKIRSSSNYRSKYGVERFALENALLILPKPSASADGGTQPFMGRIGRLRHFALAILAAISPVSREIVHLSMDLPSSNEDKYNAFTRAPIVFPLLCGHILTHTISSICGIFGYERALSDSKGNPSHFIHSVQNRLPPSADVFADCSQMIKIGFLGRLLQALLGYLSYFRIDTSQGGNTQFDESKIVYLLEQIGESSSVESGREISVWEASCFTLLKYALGSRFPQLRSTAFQSHSHKITKTKITDFFEEVCHKAKSDVFTFLCSTGFIMQVLIPGSASLFDENERNYEKGSDDRLRGLMDILSIESVEKQLSSAIVRDVLMHWYNSSVPQTSNKLALSTRIGFRGQDWPLQNEDTLEVEEYSQKTIPFLGGCHIHGYCNKDRLQIQALPVSYTDLYAELSQSCSSELTAVCLVCGEVLDAGGKGRCTRHALECGGGAGIFFLLQECIGLLIHKEKATYIHSIYVDKNGETPRFRGRPLYLDHGRYELLHQLWSGHLIRDSVMSEREKTRRQLLIGNFY